MHEYHEAIHIIEHAVEQAKAEGKSRVTKIFLVIGESSGYSGDVIKMHFEEAAAGTICEGAEIVVRPVKSMLRCPNCHELFPRKLFDYACPHCGTEGEPCEVGREMAIEDIEAQ